MELAQHPPVADWTGKVELLEGEIVRMAPANIPHWRVQHDTAQKLRAIFAEAGRDWVAGAEPTVRFADRTVRVPDIGVFRAPDLRRPLFDVADLFIAVEVADTSLRLDLGPKLVAYADASVPHYWVIDVKASEIVLMAEPADGRYRTSVRHAFGEPVAVPGTDATIVVD